MKNYIEEKVVERVRKEIIEEVFKIEKEKWRDAEHCTCLGYALIQISGVEGSEGRKKMEERLHALKLPITVHNHVYGSSQKDNGCLLCGYLPKIDDESVVK